VAVRQQSYGDDSDILNGGGYMRYCDVLSLHTKSGSNNLDHIRHSRDVVSDPYGQRMDFRVGRVPSNTDSEQTVLVKRESAW